MESITINGYISHTALSESGKHLVCTLRDESRPKDRFMLLEPNDATIATGTEIVNGTFEYGVDKEGNAAEPVWKDTDGGRFCYHIGYLVDAEKLKKGTGCRGKLAKLLAEQE